jgi:hypothetical protein
MSAPTYCTGSTLVRSGCSSNLLARWTGVVEAAVEALACRAVEAGVVRCDPLRATSVERLPACRRGARGIHCRGQRWGHHGAMSDDEPEPPASSSAPSDNKTDPGPRSPPTPGGLNEDGREVPRWTFTVALGSLPVVVAVAGAFGAVAASWAVAALFVGLAIFLFLVSLWFAPGNLRGVASALIVGVVGAGLIVGAMLGFSRLARDVQTGSTPAWIRTSIPWSPSPDDYRATSHDG